MSKKHYECDDCAFSVRVPVWNGERCEFERFCAYYKEMVAHRVCGCDREPTYLEVEDWEGEK